MESSAIKVLLIDDEKDLLDVSKQFLELDRSISVDTTISATDSLKLIELRQYDVIVCDYQIPGKDGIQLLREIRAMGNSIPFILFTGKGREEVAIAALNSGADFYLQKGGQSASQFAELANMIRQAHAREKGERALRISEERYRSLFENSVDAVMLATIDFESILSANPSACFMFGMTEEEIRRSGIKGLIVNDKDWEIILQRLNQAGIIKGRFTYRRKDGATFTGETTSGILTGQYGLARISMIVRDVTERELSDKIIRESEVRFRNTFDWANDAILLHTLSAEGRPGRFIDVNQVACSMLGYSKEELLTKGPPDIVPPEFHPQLVDIVRQARTKDSFLFETVFLRKNGTTIPVESNGHLVNYEGEKIWVSHVRDITRRKRAEEALRESEKKYRVLVENATMAILVVQDGMIMLANPLFITLSGYSKQELLSKPYASFIHPDDRDMAIERFQKRLAGEKVSSTNLVRLKSKDGSIVWSEIDTVMIDWEGRPAGLNFLIDVTEKMRAEEAVRRSEEKYRQLVESSTDGIFTIDLNMNVNWANDYAHQLLGYSKSDLPVALRKLVPIKYWPATLKLFYGGLKGKIVAEPFELEVRTKSGKRIPVSYKGTLLHDENNVITSVLGIIRVSRESKSQKAAVEVTEEYLHSIGTSDSIVLWEMDRAGIITRIEGNALTHLGLKKEELIGKSVLELNNDNPKLLALIRRGLAGEETITEAKVMDMYWRTEYTPRRDDQGNVSGLIGVSIDITEQIRTEEALKESEEKYRSILDQVDDAIIIHDENGRVIDVNKKLCESLGYSREELLSMSVKDIDPDAIQARKDSLWDAVLKGETFTFESRQIRKDGRTLPVEVRLSSVHLPHGSVVLGIVKDITERKTSEELLREREEWYQTLVFNSCIGVGFWKTDGTLLYLNEISLNRLKGTEADFIGKNMREIFPSADADRYLERIHMAAVSAYPSEYEDFVKLPVGEGWFLSVYGRIVDQNGAIRGIQVLSIDITERKRVEGAMRDTQVQLRIAMDLAKLVHWEYDVDKDLFSFDNQFYALYGSSEEKEGGELMSSATYAKRFIPPEEAGVVAEETAKALQTTDPNYIGNVTHTIIRSDGERRTINVRFGIIKDATGRTVKTFGVNQDITELKRTEDAFRIANHKLNLLSSITRHDINNQVMALEGHLALLTMKHPDYSSEENILKVETAAKRISAMIHFTKEYEDVGVKAPIWQNIRKLVEMEAKEVALGPINLVNDIPYGVEIFADPLLSKVFYNLIDNGMRHGEKTTTIHFSMQESDGVHLIVCEDDGVGIPLDTKEKLFTRGSGKDHGFGLFLSREILAITGISIAEQGMPSRGARLIIAIPAEGLRITN